VLAARIEIESEPNMEELSMSAESNTDRLVADLKRIVQDSEALLHATKDAVGDKAEEVRGRLVDTLAAAKSTCYHLEDHALERARVADRNIRDHPYQSIGVALGIGLLFGVLLTSKRTA
jgi:ElaB/YqjD/DUF883 family membrane-anchored ribosome-binding protein